MSIYRDFSMKSRYIISGGLRMDTTDSRTFIGFAVLDCLYWAYIGAFLGYISTYLLSNGLSSSLLSIVLAGFMAASFAGAFFWGGMCDKRQTNKKIFLLEFPVSIALAFIIYFMASRNIWISAILYPVFGFFNSPLGSNLDSWMLRSFDRSAAVYGRARAVGSIGYAVMMLVCGQLINYFGYSVIPAATAISAAIVFVLALIMREKPYETRKTSAQPEKAGFSDLLKIRPYVFMIVILFLTGLAISPINNLKIIILESVGGDVSSLGMDAFIGVLFQSVFIFISGQLKLIPKGIRLFLIPLLVLVTLSLTYFAVAPFMIILGTVINNVSYGIMLPTMREITESSVSGPLKNRAHAMCDATYGSFAGVIALIYSGFLMDTFGARSVALLGMAVMLVPVAMTFVTMLKEMHKA